MATSTERGTEPAFLIMLNAEYHEEVQKNNKTKQA